MRGFLVRGLIAALGLWVASALLPGVHSTGVLPLLGAGLLLGLVNAIIRPVIVILTLPITVVTLGLFLLVINGLMVILVGKIMGGFAVDGMMQGILTAIIVSVVSWIANGFIGPRGNVERFAGGRRAE